MKNTVQEYKRICLSQHIYCFNTKFCRHKLIIGEHGAIKTLYCNCWCTDKKNYNIILLLVWPYKYPVICFKYDEHV